MARTLLSLHPDELGPAARYVRLLREVGAIPEKEARAWERGVVALLLAVETRPATEA